MMKFESTFTPKWSLGVSQAGPRASQAAPREPPGSPQEVQRRLQAAPVTPVWLPQAPLVSLWLPLSTA